MVRVEFIAGKTDLEIAKNINKWLKNNENVEVKDIDSRIHHAGALITYEIDVEHQEKPKERQKPIRKRRKSKKSCW